MLWLQDSEIITHLCCKDLVAAEEVTVWETSTWSQRRTSSLISADNHVSIIAFVMFCRIVLNRGGILWLSWTRQIQLLCSDLLPPSVLGWSWSWSSGRSQRRLLTEQPQIWIKPVAISVQSCAGLMWSGLDVGGGRACPRAPQAMFYSHSRDLGTLRSIKLWLVLMLFCWLDQRLQALVWPSEEKPHKLNSAYHCINICRIMKSNKNSLMLGRKR